MKTNELMIGDWVCTEHDSTPRQIDWIRTGEVGLFWNKVATPPYLVPIPLTLEILKKNGFDINGISEYMQPVEERDWSDDTYVWSRQETPDERMEVSVYMDDPYNFFAEIICQYCHVDGIHIKYVHELQHALRLCGIEKDIEL